MTESPRPVQRHILLVITGGIAAYKALELIRLLDEASHRVTAVLTAGAMHFVTPLSVQALTGTPIYTDLWSLTDEQRMGHIELSRAADLVVVAPASADFLAKMAAGLADDLASTLLLATDKPVLVAPAMNVRMWQHAATQANVATLRARGIQFVGPETGVMACHEFGPGRLAQPPAILSAIEAFFDATFLDAAIPAGFAAAPLAGHRLLVTAGPTHEPIDPVRYLANRSSGLQGFSIASALAALGGRVTLVSGPVNLPDPPGVDVRRVQTAEQMLAACQDALPADAAIFAAAVADWRLAAPAVGKMKKSAGPPILHLVPNPDILAIISVAGPRRPRLTVGFAAETEDVLAHAAAKRLAKNCDWVVANDVRPETGIMGGTHNRVSLIDAAGREDWPLLPKQDVARRLAVRIAAALVEPTSPALAGVVPNSRALAGVEPNSRALAGVEPNSRALAGVEPNSRALAGVEPNSRALAGVEPNSRALAGDAG
jgi:phosphopantothenoylcysteine decarboxylase/phosphopantothenate--cysteine ligase